MLEELVADYGWAELGSLIDIRYFNNDPSIKSSLKFLRKTDWARKEVEALYLIKKEGEYQRLGNIFSLPNILASGDAMAMGKTGIRCHYKA